MKKKYINIIGVVFIFLIGFVIHGLYEWFPNFFTIIISPVNESIFEHIKMIYTSYIIWIIIKYFLLKKYGYLENSYLFKELLTTVFEIVLFLLIFVPVYKATGENLFVTLTIYFITIVISAILNSKIKFKKDYKYLNIISLISIIIIYVILTYLSYNPIICNFFLDPTSNRYGLNK